MTTPHSRFNLTTLIWLITLPVVLFALLVWLGVPMGQRVSQVDINSGRVRHIQYILGMQTSDTITDTTFS